jgi:predicted nucleic acid-binding protein
MTGSKLFFDTPPVIYLVEEVPDFFHTVTLFLAQAIQNEAILVTSAVTLAEVGIKPKKFKQTDLETKFERVLGSTFEVQSITWNVAEISATLRAKYASLRGMDSLQIACAIATGCDAFITNDRRLKIVKEIRIQQITDLRL